LRVLLLGDSFSQDFVNMSAEANLLPNAEIRVRYIHTKCQIYIGQENWMDFVQEKDHASCANVYTGNYYPNLQPLVQSANIIILSSLWLEWAALHLPETIKNLQIPNSARVIVIGGKNFGKISPLNYIGLSIQEKAVRRNSVNTLTINASRILRQNLEDMPNVEFVDVHELVCGKDSETCPVFSPDGKLLSFDGSHLTESGAIYIGGLLKEHPVFKSLQTIGLTEARNGNPVADWTY